MKMLHFIVLLTLSILVLVILALINFDLQRQTYKGTLFTEENLSLDHIIVIPEEVILDMGDTRRMTAFAANRAGRILSNYALFWSSEDTSVATIDRLGILYAKKHGATIVTAHAKVSGVIPTTLAIPVIVIPDGVLYIPAGEFFMGSNLRGMANEQPLHKVFVDGYFIDEYEVTNEQFAEFLNHISVNYYDERMQIVMRDGEYVSIEDKRDFPVSYVSWLAAADYAEWMGKRLPTEAEWEKAGRGALDARNYPFGASISGSEANYRKSGDPFEQGTTPVGFYDGRAMSGFQTRNSPSLYGAYDMSGNVAEWTADWYQMAYYKQNVLKNPTGPVSGKERTIRGGSWFDTQARLRISYRTSGNPSMKNEMVGFRCAKTFE